MPSIKRYSECSMFEHFWFGKCNFCCKNFDYFDTKVFCSGVFVLVMLDIECVGKIIFKCTGYGSIRSLFGRYSVIECARIHKGSLK